MRAMPPAQDSRFAGSGSPLQTLQAFPNMSDTQAITRDKYPLL